MGSGDKVVEPGCVDAITISGQPVARAVVIHRTLRVAGLPATRAELDPLHASERLRVLKVVWAPGMRFRPTNHLISAAIGLYGGREDNRLRPGGRSKRGRRDPPTNSAVATGL